jgi:hypothetical protein
MRLGAFKRLGRFVSRIDGRSRVLYGWTLRTDGRIHEQFITE